MAEGARIDRPYIPRSFLGPSNASNFELTRYFAQWYVSSMPVRRLFAAEAAIETLLRSMRCLDNVEQLESWVADNPTLARALDAHPARPPEPSVIPKL